MNVIPPLLIVLCLRTVLIQWVRMIATANTGSPEMDLTVPVRIDDAFFKNNDCASLRILGPLAQFFTIHILEKNIFLG